MTAVAIYARYSSDNQRDASIEDQIRLCQERAAKEGWRIHNCYTDHALSGASLMRPGIQMLMQDALGGRFEVIIAEALDRLSRDQEDIAGIYKRLRFAGVRIVTLSEGDVSDLHIGLKGTMNALYLKDLADKTRRGLRGRVEAGKSGGGLTYGYDVVKKFDASGEAIRGERTINAAQAAIVVRIFNDYASGRSPKAIVHQLNKEGVPCPCGQAWGASTIHGHRRRGTGILNNELYIGRMIWNRLRYIKDPETGKRVSRLNPESEWIVKDVPSLRIVDQELWERVKARQRALEATEENSESAGFWDRRRPQYLFSGLLKCGQCGGGFVKYSHDRLGCATARNKGTCSNLLTIKRSEVEAAVLNGLKSHLMDERLCAVFCEEYTAHMNRLRIEANASLEGYKAELGKIGREVDRYLDAIGGGLPVAQVKDRMIALEERKTVLKGLIERSREQPVLLHPNMSQHYRQHVAELIEALNDEDRRNQATSLIRSLVDRIVLRPEDSDGGRSLAIDLEGHLAGILSLAAKGGKGQPESGSGRETKLVAGTGLGHGYRGGAKGASTGKTDLIDSIEEIKLVAGAGFEPATFRL
ncbi:MAG: recombinase family protein [Rhodospirillales bacterium]|nr:recombinase family protein [Rhodospirillales bacterium]